MLTICLGLTIAECIGIAGFILAFITFCLTRYEKRKKLILTLYDGVIEQIGAKNLVDTYKDTDYVIMEIINNCEKIIVIDKDSIRLVINKKEIDRKVEWVNIDETEAFLNPGTQIKYAVGIEELFRQAEINPNTKKVFKIEGYLKDVSGNKYKTKHKYYIDNISKAIRRE